MKTLEPKMTARLLKSSVLLALCAIAPALSAQPDAPPGPNPRREMLEQRLRERTGDLVRRRLQLTDEQMKQLQATNRQFEQQRGSLLMREREMRRSLRAEILAGEKANQARVAQLLDQTLQLERQRLDLVQNEQRELAKFLTPVQRAKLFGLQNELRRRAQELRAGPGQRRNAPPGGPRRFNP
jgi:Spy/CpxP family protein refolding chaperone